MFGNKKIIIAGGSLLSKLKLEHGSDIDIFLYCNEEEGNEIIKYLFNLKEFNSLLHKNKLFFF
jgi:hypothetical protein